MPYYTILNIGLVAAILYQYKIILYTQIYV